MPMLPYQTAAVRARAVQIVKTYIAKHYTEEITLEQLGREANYSPHHLSRVFSEETGTPVMAHLAQVRIEAAKTLLATTNLSVTSIVHRIGRSSVGTFSTAFRAKVGHTPTAYRALAHAKMSEDVDV